MSENKIWTREFVGMGLTNFFYFMSQYILIAALPVFIMDDLGKGQWEAGMAMTCFQIGTVLCRPLAGRIIDGVNKQKLLWVRPWSFSCSWQASTLLLPFRRYGCSVLCTGRCLPWAPRRRRLWRRWCCQEGARERGSVICGVRQYGHGHRAAGGPPYYGLSGCPSPLYLPVTSGLRRHSRRQREEAPFRGDSSRRKEEGRISFRRFH